MKAIKTQKQECFFKEKNLPMNLFSYYQDFFHDGSIHAITRLDDEMIFEMETSQMYLSWNRDRLPLSDFHTLYGRLHAKGIVSLKRDGQPVDSLSMETNSAAILELYLSDHRIHLFGVWYDHQAHTDIGFEFEVIAKEIYWENTANTTDPTLLGKYMGLEEDDEEDFDAENDDKTHKNLNN